MCLENVGFSAGSGSISYQQISNACHMLFLFDNLFILRFPPFAWFKPCLSSLVKKKKIGSLMKKMSDANDDTGERGNTNPSGRGSGPKGRAVAAGYGPPMPTTPTGTEFVKKFVAKLGDLLHEEVLKPGGKGRFRVLKATIGDCKKKGHGDHLEEGIWTRMRLGDLELIGSPADAPDEAAVHENYHHFNAGHELAPLRKLLPTLTLTGTEDTKPGAWKLLYDSEKARLWAFLWMLGGMRQDISGGLGRTLWRSLLEESFKKIMVDLENVPVLLIKMKATDELWEEWSKSQDVGHTLLLDSVDRCSVCFAFFSRLKQNLKVVMQKTGIGKDITGKELFSEYKDAEAAKKFKIAEGMTPVRCDNELSQLMKWGETTTKFGWMPGADWK